MSQGKLGDGAPYINTFNTFPQFGARAGEEIDLKERINGPKLKDARY